MSSHYGTLLRRTHMTRIVSTVLTMEYSTSVSYRLAAVMGCQHCNQTIVSKTQGELCFYYFLCCCYTMSISEFHDPLYTIMYVLHLLLFTATEDIRAL